jgi:hypothetical protein
MREAAMTEVIELRNYELETRTLDNNRMVEFMVRDNTDGLFDNFVVSVNIQPECFGDENGNVSVLFCVKYGRLDHDSDQRFLTLEAAKAEVDARIEKAKVQYEAEMEAN